MDISIDWSETKGAKSTEKVDISASKAEYHFYGMQDKFIDGIINTSNPVFMKAGMEIKQHRRLILNSIFETSTANSFISAGIWLYYIEGELGNFMSLNVNIKDYGEDQIKIIGSKGKGLMITGSKDNTPYYAQVYTGWNWITVSVSKEYIRGNNCFDSSCTKSTQLKHTRGSIRNLDEVAQTTFVGCFDGVDTSVHYLAHSMLVTDGYDLTSTTWTNISPTNPYLNFDLMNGGNSNRHSNEQGDDGNILDSDGGDGTGIIEPHAVCTQAVGFRSVCSVCGNGTLEGTEECDDGNHNTNDGGDAQCKIEYGFECRAEPQSLSHCHVKCGDGIVISQFEEGDDHNTDSLDGCSSIGKIEFGFNCINTSLNNSPTKCDEKGGDGFLFDLPCDDGNSISGDGCSSNGTIEPGYSCYGGSPSQPSTCMTLGGDGVFASDHEECDDNNTFSGDGCSADGIVEQGYTCELVQDNLYTSCNETGGDGRRAKNTGCDDGNTINGDGCSALGAVETGYEGKGGTLTKRDVGTEKGGDEIHLGINQCEDGNKANGDGGSEQGMFEKGFQGIGEDEHSIDVCEELVIKAHIEEKIASKLYYIVYEKRMYQTRIGLNDLAIGIKSSRFISLSWQAEYIDEKTLKIEVDINSVLKGNETLIVNITNYQTIRGEHGGCVRPEIFNKTLESSLKASAESARSFSSFTKYFVMGGILSIFLILMIGGGSIEMIWSLINTLQFITYFPEMIPYYPDHVKIMFDVLKFVNMNFGFTTDLFNSITSLDKINTKAYGGDYDKFGSDSPLFIQIGSSLFSSLIITICILIVLVILYFVLCGEKAKIRVLKIISFYYWNNFLRFFTEGYLELVFGAVLNISERKLSSSIAVVSFILAGICIIPLIIFPFISFALLYDKRKDIGVGHPTYLKRFGTMYKDFKSDKEWYLLQYYPIFLLRRLVFIIFLIMMVSYPEGQCNGFILVSISMCVFQIYCKPFKEDIINWLCSFNEITLFLISFIQTIFITNLAGVQAIDITGWLMISMVICMILFNFGVIIPHAIYLKYKKGTKKEDIVKRDRVTSFSRSDSSLTSISHPSETMNYFRDNISRLRQSNIK